MNETQSIFRAGDLIRGQYKVVDLLGQGETGAVYLVTDERDHQKRFALKEVTHAVQEDRRGFPFDPAALKRLDHPALPRIHRLFHGEKQEQSYILTDYVEGHSLEVMRDLMPGKRFSLHAAMTLMSPIMDAVSYLHQQHPPLIHGDINPSNIIPPNAGTATSAKLVDFGGSKSAFTDAPSQEDIHSFRAPEQYGKRTSRRSDVYALGAIFYTLLTGTVPPAASYRLAQIEAGGADPLLPMNQFMPINQVLVRAIHCALSISRQDRYASVEEFRQALWQVIHANEKVTQMSGLSIAMSASEDTGPVLSDLLVASPPHNRENDAGDNAEVGARPIVAENTGLAINASRREGLTTPDVSSGPTFAFITPEFGKSPVRGLSPHDELPVMRWRRRKRKTRKFVPLVLAFLLVCVVGSGVAVAGYQTYEAKYHSDQTLAKVGLGHLQTALQLLQRWSAKPLSASSVQPAQHEFAAATADFARLQDDLQSFPSSITMLPHYGSLLRAAVHIVPIALEISRAGAYGCDAINKALIRLREPFGSTGLAFDDLTSIGQDLQQVEANINLATAQVKTLQPADLRFDIRVGKAVAAFHQYLPTVQAFLNEAHQLLPALSRILGVGKQPAFYLIEILDSTELRPGGGFIKDYGFATIIGGRLSLAQISDTNLISRSGQYIPYPSLYRWFNKDATSWNINDSNLEADFPKDASYAEQNYYRQGGREQLQGVIAITPALMEQALAITGPISIPELHLTVTSQNLISLIHKNEPWLTGQSSSLGKAAGSKQFTQLLAQQFLKRFHQIRSTAIARLFQMLVSSMRTKDLQIYFNDPAAESLLRLSHVDGTIQAPTTGDSLFVVDANISANNANQFITDTIDDQVTIDNNGNTTHHTSIRYAWSKTGYVFGPQQYSDYVRVYVPPGSSLQAQQGWQQRGSSRAFGRDVWAGSFTLSSGQTNIISFTWTEHHVAKKDAASWHYQYLIQRQASTNSRLSVEITLPSCAVKTQTSGGLVLRNEHTAILNQPLYQDMNPGIEYRC